jgi:cell division protein FtsW
MDFFKKYFKGDPYIWAIILGLSVFSLLAVYSSTGTLAHKFQQGNTAFYIFRHSRFLIVALMATFVLQMFPYKYYARISQWLLIIVVPMLFVTLLSGSGHNAPRWLSIFGMTFQTSDFAKMALIMYLAQRLAVRQDVIQDFKKTVIPMYVVICLVCVLIMPANLSTAVLLFFVCMIMLFVGRVSIKHMSKLALITAVAGTMLIGGLYGLKQVGVNNVATQRVETWVNRVVRHFSADKDVYSLSGNYQIEQAKIAIGTGGIFGKAPGNSVQRNFLPHPYSDFIFAIIVEEFGVIGAIIILFLYINLLYRSIAIVRKCDKTFPAFLVIGLSLVIVVQALINMAVAVGVIPVTGQPLPLISMGGTSMLFTGAALGIILSISREQNEEDVSKKPRTKIKKPEEISEEEQEQTQEETNDLNN